MELTRHFLGRVNATLALFLTLALASVSPAVAIDVRRPATDPGVRVAPGYAAPELIVTPALVTYDANAALAAAPADALQRFFAEHSSNWEVRWDQRNARPHLIEGVGLPLLPGAGNTLTPDSAGLDAARALDLRDVERLVRDLLARYPELFRVSPGDLRLDPRRSAILDGGRLIYVELQQTHAGVPVEGASLYFRIRHGNLVQFGADTLAEVGVRAVPSRSRDQAFDALLSATGLPVSQLNVSDRGTLKLLPMLTAGERPGEAFEGQAGRGYAHVLAWEFRFTRAGDVASYHALVDARTGRLLRFEDENRTADAVRVPNQVVGGVYPQTNTDTETVMGFPYAKVNLTMQQEQPGFAEAGAPPSSVCTDANGYYTYPGGSVSSQLDGCYVRINDACGAISLSSSGSYLHFGLSGGTDCTTPGVGGAGNTHAARTGFYHLSTINRKAASYLPGNAWLNGVLTANMNINNYCNAYWSPSAGTVNFYRSGGGCSNTGEIAAVFLHEWGHGMDQNSGGTASEQGSGEAVGDTFAFIQTRNACIGPNFTPGVPCYNCNASCTGVRDLASFALNGSHTIAKPANVTSNTGIDCDRWSCPYYYYGQPYMGPMGYEGHCESYIAGSANWDLAQKLVAAHGTETGWARMEWIWYNSLVASKSAYQVASGGQCNPSATVNGCGATNWYNVFLVADDDDGNLANGTPNKCRIWEALDAHGIACGARPTECYPPLYVYITRVGSWNPPQVVYAWASGGVPPYTSYAWWRKPVCSSPPPPEPSALAGDAPGDAVDPFARPEPDDVPCTAWYGPSYTSPPNQWTPYQGPNQNIRVDVTDSVGHTYTAYSWID